MDKDEALKLALEALEESKTNNDTMEFHDRKNKAITAIKQVLAAPTVQEPVGYVAENGVVDWNVCAPPILTDLYTTPPAQPAPVQEPGTLNIDRLGQWLDASLKERAAQRQWVGLEEKEIDKLKHLIDWTATWSHGRFAYEIEQLLKEKNA